MCCQRNKMIKKFIIISLMTLTLNSYASNCREEFGNNSSNESTSQPLLQPAELELFQKNAESNLTVIKEFINKIIEAGTSISSESDKFDTFTRDSLLIDFIQKQTESVKSNASNMEQLSERIDSLMPTVTNIIKSNPEEHQDTHILKALKEAKDETEKVKLRLKEAIKIYESQVEQIRMELEKPANKDRLVDSRFDTEDFIIDVASSLMNAMIEQASNKLVQSPINHTITEAEAFIERYSAQKN